MKYLNSQEYIEEGTQPQHKDTISAVTFLNNTTHMRQVD